MKTTAPSRMPPDVRSRKLNRLSGWKMIAQHLGCTVRTARRWEAMRALPVHRIPGGSRGSVWALAEELNAWLNAYSSSPELGDTDEAEVGALERARPEIPAAPLLSEPTTTTDLPRSRLGTVALAGVACAVFAAAGLALSFYAHKPTSAVPQSTAYDDDGAARDSYLNAHFALSLRTAASLENARERFSALTRQYPARAPAWSGLADTFLLLREFGSLSDEKAYPQAAAAAKVARSLDPKLSDAWLDSAFIDFWWNSNRLSAFQEFATALELNPGSANAYHWYATALQAHGDNDEALAAFVRARTLDPGNRAIVADEGWALFAAGRRAEGLEQLERLVAIDPSFVDGQEWLARMYLLEARDEDFLRAAHIAATLRGQQTRLSNLEVASEQLKHGGRAAMLRELIEMAEQEWRAGTGSAMVPAVYEAIAGDRAGTLQWLATAQATHDHSLDLATMPVFQDVDKETVYKNVIAQLR